MISFSFSIFSNDIIQKLDLRRMKCLSSHGGSMEKSTEMQQDINQDWELTEYW